MNWEINDLDPLFGYQKAAKGEKEPQTIKRIKHVAEPVGLTSNRRQ
jgi:hypothetical protein